MLSSKSLAEFEEIVLHNTISYALRYLIKQILITNFIDYFFSTIKLNENFKNKILKVSGIHTLGANTSFIWKSIKSPAESSAIILMLKIAKSKKPDQTT